METEVLRNNIMNRLKILNDIEPLSFLFESMQGEYAVLSLIAERKLISPSEISITLNISKARSTVILHTLKKKKFVEVAKVHNDKRKLVACLTPLGEDSLHKKNTQASTFFDDYLTELGQEDTQKLLLFLDKSINIAQNKFKNK